MAGALAALILLPAHLSGRLAAHPGQAVLNYLLYLVFFGTGTLLLRTLRHGRLAPRQQDAQRGSPGARLALVLFAAGAVPAGHFAAWFDPTLGMLVNKAAVSLVPAATRVLSWLLPAVGYGLMLAGAALNVASAAALGKAFDRLVQPERLVTTGPYALVRHPIYTSYMCLFVGHCLSLGSCAAGTCLLAACLLYYRCRTQLEEALLESAFGQQYVQYRACTGCFMPRLMGRGLAASSSA